LAHKHPGSETSGSFARHWLSWVLEIRPAHCSRSGTLALRVLAPRIPRRARVSRARPCSTIRESVATPRPHNSGGSTSTIKSEDAVGNPSDAPKLAFGFHDQAEPTRISKRAFAPIKSGSSRFKITTILIVPTHREDRRHSTNAPCARVVSGALRFGMVTTNGMAGDSIIDDLEGPP
jgi:hypothetical protein